MNQKTRYALTAAIGDQLAGSFVELTDAQAESALYASRVAPLAEASEGGPSRDELRAEILAELEAKVPEYLANAQAEGKRLASEGKAQAEEMVKAAEAKVEAANAEARRLVEAAKTEATGIVTAAQAEAMKLATAGKK